MRRGSTLIEMVVSLAVLAVAGSVSLRLLFSMDRAMAPEQRGIAETAGRAQLLSELGTDVRAAREVTATRGTLALSGAVPVRYSWSESEQGTVRRAIGAEPATTVYPHVRATFTPAGAVLRVRLQGEDTDMRTAYYMRNR